jgi:hypothetical protein
MEPKRSWWQQIKIHPVRIVLIAFLAAVIVLIISGILGYIFNWDWTGLGPYVSPPHSKDSNFQRGKTPWDWLQLLIIPAMLALENLSQVSQFASALSGLQGFLSSPKFIELEWSHDFC